MDSILDSVKSYLGIPLDSNAFDNDVIMSINAIMFVLNQFGIGPSEPFVVENSSQTWSDLLGDEKVGSVRQYVNMRVRMLFDPPTNNQVMDALKGSIDEFEWRILVDVDESAYKAREVEGE